MHSVDAMTHFSPNQARITTYQCYVHPSITVTQDMQEQNQSSTCKNIINGQIEENNVVQTFLNFYTQIYNMITLCLLGDKSLTKQWTYLRERERERQLQGRVRQIKTTRPRINTVNLKTYIKNKKIYLHLQQLSTQQLSTHKNQNP